MVYILCPAMVCTGGTELLHQLGNTLNNLGFAAAMRYYAGAGEPLECHPEFLHYGVPVVQEITDSPDSVIVIPEVMTKYCLSIRTKYIQSRRILWWLSVNNAVINDEVLSGLRGDTGLFHLVQCYYAQDYLLNTVGIPKERVDYLSDYIAGRFLNIAPNADRNNEVLFNPKKGFDRTARLIQASDSRIVWRPLAGVKQHMIPELLKKAKVYIDFGEHPGKDRFPREAASCGCLVITGKRGAAAFPEDVPLPENFKFEDEAEDTVILDAIYEMLKDYEETAVRYRDYVDWIREEYHSFEMDALRIFSALQKNEYLGMEFFANSGLCFDERTDAIAMSEDSFRERILLCVQEECHSEALLWLTLYRTRHFDMDLTMRTLEIYTRLGLGEHQKAQYLARKALTEKPEDYELTFLLGRALYEENASAEQIEECLNVLQKAVTLSEGTEDQAYIGAAVCTLIGGAREYFSLFSRG